MIKDLNLNNYLKLSNLINNNNFVNNFFSPSQLIQWLYYDIEIKYHIIDDCILMYMKNKNEEWKLLNPFYKKNFNLDNALTHIKQDILLLNNSDMIYVTNFNQESIDIFKVKNIEKLPWISNYLYELNQLKTFSGKKMQKKRNHLNYFINQKHNIKIKDIRDVPVDELISFSEYLIKKYDNEIRKNEINSYIATLNEINKSELYSGITIYIDDKLCAFTLGFLNKDTYEIIIEKAEIDIRGLYQFLIKTNLEINNINCKYIDRLDDLGLESLRKSKLSYHPIIYIERYLGNL